MTATDAITIWSWRWRQEIHGMKWIKGATMAPDYAEAWLADARQQEPKVVFAMTEGSIPAWRPSWDRQAKRWVAP